MMIIRSLVLLRGAMGAGKSFWIKENNLQQFTLSADDIRLMFQTPVMTESGQWAINSKNDNKVWKILLELLEERMKRGEFTIIDATHAKQEVITRYKVMAQKYRYRVHVVDFSDVPLEKLLEQNKMREEHKFVPEHVIMNAYERMQTEHVPKWVNTIKPDEFHQTMQYTKTDFSEYERIHHIGDIHGSYDALMDYFNEVGDHAFYESGSDLYPILNEYELYIFVGDLLDRGTQNAETLNFFLNICNRKNVIIIEGNHEYHLSCWSHDEEIKSKEFINHTQPQLESGLDEEQIVELKKETRQLCRKLRQLVYYNYNFKDVVVTHGGIAKMPDDLMCMATDQFIKGVGDYEVDIDNAWDENLDPAWDYNTDEKVTMLRPIYQIHGHRNIFRLPTQAGKHSFNLEGQCELGAHLRAVTLTGEGFHTYDIKNDNFKIRAGVMPITIDEKNVSMEQFIAYMSNHKEINERDLGDNIFSYSFSRDAFRDKIWDDINVKARGLFINKNTLEIVSRSYNKFFNVGERSFTKISALADNLVMPVQVYDKPNGYLGIVGYNIEKDELVFSSKAETRNEHAKWFKDLFMEKFGDVAENIKNDLLLHNVSLVFEVIKAVEDRHIIEYPEDKLVLLDVVKRQVTYEKLDYDLMVLYANCYGMEHKKLIRTFDDWTSFYVWYRDVTKDMSVEDEGFVIEDAVGFMTKIKLPYYRFWKFFRDSVKDTFAKRHDHLIKGASMNTSLHNKVFKWMKMQDAKWLKDSDIITVRNKFEHNQKTEAMTEIMVKIGIQ